MAGRLELAKSMQATGLVPPDLARDFAAYRTNLEVRLRRLEWSEQNAKLADSSGEVRGPYAMLTHSCDE
eukprot:11217129-Lingulodinium_polyedra.AAC.1